MRLRVLPVALLSLLVSACAGKGVTVPQTLSSSAGTAPVTKAQDVVTSSSGLFHPNKVKYRDAGSDPVTGRSGSAVVTSRALLGKDGVVLLEASTGNFDGVTGPGSITHALTQAITSDGVAQQASAYNGLSGSYWSQTYSGLARNNTLQLQTIVTGVDPRADVVSTSNVIKLRPDLAALRLDGPARTYTNAATSFTATVGELNGDAGARADCVLWVDGQQVDRAVGIWVDAGDTVSCQFQTSFATAGTKQVRVSVINVNPGDWDTSNNSVQTAVTVVDPAVQLGYNVFAGDYSEQDRSTYSYTADQWLQYTDSSRYSYAVSDAFIQGLSNSHAFQFPIQRLTGTITADGNPIVQEAIAAFGPPSSTSGSTCQYAYGARTFARVCSYGSGSAEAWVERLYESVTYYSSRTTYCAPSDASCIPILAGNAGMYITSSGTGPSEAFDVGNTDQFALSVTDAAGIQYNLATPPVPVLPFATVSPFSNCYPYAFGGTWCVESSVSKAGKAAQDSGDAGL